MWHLYRKKNDDNFLFVSPYCISYAPKVSCENRARNLAERLIHASSNQLALVPCNVGDHWILTIIQPHKGLVYLMGPIAHQHRATWKSVFDMAMKTFNAKMDKNFKKAPNWEIIKGPIQPDNKQCGYYVMRFMKEIVEGFQNDDSISISSLFKKKQYSQGEIDEVRNEWASCLIEHV